jgi:predicted Fe-Mo cluster-binding NifX family protein
MIAVVTGTGERPSDRADDRFGRAPWLVVYDTQRVSFAAYDNTAQVEARQGAGVLTAQRVAELQADVVLTGHCGPKAFAVLKEAGVRVLRHHGGTILEAIHDWQEGDLRPLNGPDRPGHGSSA